MFTPRPYRDPSDLIRMQALNQRCHAQARHSALHPGDLPHRIFNVLRAYDPASIVWLWEAPGGELAGWTVVYPRFGAFDSQVHPAHSDGSLAQAILHHAEAEVRAWLEREGRPAGPVNTDVFETDHARIAALRACGFEEAGHSATYTVRSLAPPLPDIELPAGFALRSVRGPQDAEAMVALRRGTFGSTWTVESYTALLRSPGYDPARELVIVAPDGRFAAHCTLWLDALNRIGLFEPLGTHAAFRGQGLGRALLAGGMARLQSAGMVEAVVWYETGNPAAQGLYTAAGFLPRLRVLNYEKPAT